MPDTKFSWRNLREHIRKYFWIYMIGIAICLVGSNLLWTTTRPRVPNEQNVMVYLADSYAYDAPLSPIAKDMLERTRAFDDTLGEVQFMMMNYNAEDYTSAMVLMTRLAVGECDAFIASQAAMDALVSAQVLEPLDEYVAQGWPGDFPLEPYYATLTDDETGESTTLLAGLRLDEVDALARMGVINNEGAFLCVTMNGGNVETTMKALEFMMEDLMRETEAGKSNEAQTTGTEAEAAEAAPTGD